MSLATFRERVLSDDPLIRRMSYRAVFSAMGDGAFLAGSAFYFTRIVGLSAAQVGLGLTVAGVLSFLIGVPSGRLVDRIGSRESWLIGITCTGVAYLCWPLVHGFAGYLAVTLAYEVASTFGRTGGGAYRIGVFPPDQRVRGNAYMRAYRNVGYTLGALLGGLALAASSDAYVKALPVFTAAVMLGDGFLISRMPSLAKPAPEETVELRVEDAVEHATEKRGALQNRGFFAMSTLLGVMGTHGVLLNTVIPLWLVTETDAPRVLLAWLFGTNTVMAVLLQVRATRNVLDLRTAVRSEYRAAACFVLSCVIVAITHDTVGLVTVALVWLGHVTVTGTELFEAAGSWEFQSSLSDPERLGEYQGVSNMGYTLGTVWAPALYTFLAMHWGAAGWAVIAAIVLVAAVLLRPSVASAQGFLERRSAPHGAESTTA